MLRRDPEIDCAEEKSSLHRVISAQSNETFVCLNRVTRNSRRYNDIRMNVYHVDLHTTRSDDFSAVICVTYAPAKTCCACYFAQVSAFIVVARIFTQN